MTIKMTMPIERDEAAETSTQAPSLEMYKPLPVEAGAKFTNELFLPLFQPDTWGIFNQDPESAQRLGMVTGNPLKVEGMPTLYTFFFKIPTHPVKNFIRPDGSVGFSSVICPHKFNEYLEKNLGYKPLFTNTRCAFCEATIKSWGAHNERWEQVERDTGIIKRDLKKEGYLKLRNEDAGLAQTYKQAQMFRLQDRYILMPFDHGKMMGTRPSKEGDVNTYLPWFAPKTVVNTLKELWKNADSYNQPAFFDFSNPTGLQVLAVVKDTTQCSGQSMLKTEYSVMNGPLFPYDEAWKGYLTNLDSMPDPTALLTVLSHAEQSVYAFPQQESYNSPAVNQQASQPPQAMQATQALQAAAPRAAAPVQQQAKAPASQAAPASLNVPAAAPPVATPPVPQMTPPPQAAPPSSPPTPAMAPATPAPAPVAAPAPVMAAPAPQMAPPQMPAAAPVPAPSATAPAFAAGAHAPVDEEDDISW